MKVGVVSVTVEQHTEGRLQDSQAMLDLEVAVRNAMSRFGDFLREGRTEIVFRRDERCGQHLIIADP